MNFLLSHHNIFLIAWLGFLFFLEKINNVYFSGYTKTEYDRWLKNGLFGVINRFTGPLVMLPIMIWATQMHFWVRPLWASGVIFLIVDILILDMTSYWFHRVSHKFPFLWRFHEIHHLDSNFDSTTGLRIHFGEIFFQNLFRIIPIIIFSISLKSVLIFELVLITEGLFHHSNIRIPKFLDKILSTVLVMPNRHCVHHHSLYTDWNSNYGFICIWWDKLFGTFNTSERKNTWHIGLGYAPDLNGVHLLTSPFIFKKLRTRMKERSYKVMRDAQEKNYA